MTEWVYDSVLAVLVITAWVLWWRMNNREQQMNNTAGMEHYRDGRWVSCDDEDCEVCR